MRRLLRKHLFFVFAFIGFLTACHPMINKVQAITILSQSILATGKIVDVKISKEFVEGMEGASIEEWHLPDKMHSIGTIDDVKVEQIHIQNTLFRRFTDTNGQWQEWEEIAAPLDKNPFDFLKRFGKTTYTGDAFSEEKDCYIILLEEPLISGSVSFHEDKYTVWIDKETDLPIKAEVEGYWVTPAIQTLIFYDYSISNHIKSPK